MHVITWLLLIMCLSLKSRSLLLSRMSYKLFNLLQADHKVEVKTRQTSCSQVAPHKPADLFCFKALNLQTFFCISIEGTKESRSFLDSQSFYKQTIRYYKAYFTNKSCQKRTVCSHLTSNPENLLLNIIVPILGVFKLEGIFMRSFHPMMIQINSHIYCRMMYYTFQGCM